MSGTNRTRYTILGCLRLKPMSGNDIKGVIDKLLLQCPILPGSYAASKLYHDVCWYPAHGKQRGEKTL